MAVGTLLPVPGQLAVLVLGTVMFDLGVQHSLIAHQTTVYGLDTAARSRLNAVLMTSLFVGMAAGSALGSLLLARCGWVGVMTLSTLAAAAAFAVQARRAVR